MLFWVALAVLGSLSVGGSIYFDVSRRSARPKMYSAFIYACAALFASLPLATGDWQWAFASSVAAVWAARRILARSGRSG